MHTSVGCAADGFRIGSAPPADLVELEGRFAAPVFPGDDLGVEVWSEPEETVFTVTRHDQAVISGGRARFR